MKKLSLNAFNHNLGKVLSRSELKQVMGGHGELCETHKDCPAGHVCVQTVLDRICCDSDDLHGTGPHPLPFCRNVRSESSL